MKISILHIFKNIKTYFAFVTLLMLSLSLVEMNRTSSYKRIKQLQAQKILIQKIYDLGRDDLEYSLINTQGLGAQIKTNIILIDNIATNDFLENFLGLNHHYKDQTQTLLTLAQRYILSANSYYNARYRELPQKITQFSLTKAALLNQINEVTLSAIDDEQKKLSFTKWLVYGSLLLTLLGAFWFSKRLSLVYEDIKSLFVIGSEKTSESSLTKEMDAIKMRMVRQPILSQNQSMIDPVTEIENYKGMLRSYAEKKGMKENDSIIVCVFEIDNFKEYENRFSEDYMQSMLKKIAFILSLYKHPTDIIARIEYDQFAVILSRETKKKALDDCEAIRASIEETQFSNPQGGRDSLTLSGGFIVKQSNKTLESTIAHAKELLQMEKNKGKTRITQISDKTEEF